MAEFSNQDAILSFVDSTAQSLKYYLNFEKAGSLAPPSSKVRPFVDSGTRCHQVFQTEPLLLECLNCTS